MQYEYKADYFKAKVTAKDVQRGFAGEKVAKQVEELVNSYNSNGFELYQQFDTQVTVNPGCLGALLGGKASQLTITTTIFRKPLSGG